MTNVLFDRFIQIAIGRRRPLLTAEQSALPASEKNALLQEILAADQDAFANGAVFTFPEFDIMFDLSSSNRTRDTGSGSFTIYNLGKKVLKKIGEDSPIIIRAGYKNFHSNIFVGRVTKFHDERQGADVKNIFLVADATKEFANAKGILSLTNIEGLLYTDLIRRLFELGNIPIGYIHPSTVIITSGNFGAAFGEPGNPTILEAAQEIAEKIGYTVTIRGDRIYAYPEGAQFFSGLKLSSQTGLLNLRPLESESEDADYEVEALIVPGVGPDVVFAVESVYPRFVGPLRVTSYQYISNLRDHKVIMKMKVAEDFPVNIAGIVEVDVGGGEVLQIPIQVELTLFGKGNVGGQ